MAFNFTNVGFCAKCGFFDRVNYPRDDVYFSDGSRKCPDCGGPALIGAALDKLASEELLQKMSIKNAIEALKTLRDEFAIAIGDMEEEEEDGEPSDPKIGEV